jgi:hypothetical protein
MNSNLVRYVTCCKLWLEFHKTDNTALLLRYKLTNVVYYELLCMFNLINIRYVSLSCKSELTINDYDLINEDLIKYNDFFDIMSIINGVMSKD